MHVDDVEEIGFGFEFLSMPLRTRHFRLFFDYYVCSQDWSYREEENGPNRDCFHRQRYFHLLIGRYTEIELCEIREITFSQRFYAGDMIVIY